MAKLRSAASDRREQIVQDVLSRIDGFTFETQTDDFAPFEWWIKRADTLVGVAEFKGRTCSSNDFPTLFLSLRKYETLMSVAKTHQIKPLIIYGFSDGVISGMDVSLVKFDWISKIERTKLRKSGNIGANDVEMAFEIPIIELKRFGIMTSTERAEYNRLGYGL